MMELMMVVLLKEVHLASDWVLMMVQMMVLMKKGLHLV